MILVDSSVWIDFLRDVPSWQTSMLDGMLDDGEVVIGDLILAEILQGLPTEQAAGRVEALLAPLEKLAIADPHLALEAARNYRLLRRKGFTVRSTIDTLIATRCINDGIALLHSDRDFIPFERELNLPVVRRLVH